MSGLKNRFPLVVYDDDMKDAYHDVELKSDVPNHLQIRHLVQIRTDSLQEGFEQT